MIECRIHQPSGRPAEGGFVVSSILILLPLIITAFAVVFAGLTLISNDSELRHICRVQTLRAQEAAADKLNQLLKLNPKAQRLRKQLEAAQKAARVAANPKAQAIARLAIAAIHAQQVILAGQQKLLLFEGKRISYMGASQTSREIGQAVKTRSTAQTEQTELNAFDHGKRAQFQLTRGEFDLDTKPATSLTPDYIPDSDFSDTQTIGVESSVPVSMFLPSWLQGWIDLKELKIKNVCSSTLVNEGGKWQAVLSQDKPLSKWL